MEPTDGDSEVLNLSAEDIRQIAADAAKDIEAIAARAGISGAELLERLGKTLAGLEARRREREAAAMEIEEPT